ncbi:aldolase/citrate lyase family protein [Haliea sp. E1-2-M8]|uniref:aldolase/citrate lyase family protein n=1 Tax=Haliea sp. E1-2-M8 TaxID=3064706 RepID=UPI00271FDA2C|nr:aldolase/citrate lyase family protein [Haliea sp. E1-2-M8]MDO8863467.1 aldolase/citrate lyase family protein [Haliea sp. E1-2-M8]
MELPANRLKRALATGRPQYGLWLGLPDNSVAEIAAGAGFDWLLIDHEHAPFELRDIMNHLQAMAAYPVAPLVRPVEGSPALLKKLLDIGVQSFLIPMVDDAAQARALVAALRYPPAGKRGLGTSMARAADWNRVPDYLQKANAEICLIVQVETAEAMDNLDEILAVEGVDGVFIGPSDLSASMGHIGNAGHPDVVASISAALSRIKAAGKYAGLLCLDPTLVDNYIAQGADFIGIGVDTMILVQGLQKLLQRGQGESETSPAPQPGY